MDYSHPLTQVRQSMASHLPEYRPYALQPLLRAATFQGGAARGRSGTSGGGGGGGGGGATPTTSELNVPIWLDLSLYFSVILLVGVAFFLILYDTHVASYRKKQIMVIGQSAMPLYSNAREAVHPSEESPPSPVNIRTPPHPPPPPHLATS